MSNYHTKALDDADIYTVMGSVYAEVSRYDNAIIDGREVQASQAVSRAKEIIDFSQKHRKLSKSQKQEIKKLKSVFLEQVKKSKSSGLDSYLMPFAVAARMRQFK